MEITIVVSSLSAVLELENLGERIVKRVEADEWDKFDVLTLDGRLIRVDYLEQVEGLSGVSGHMFFEISVVAVSILALVGGPRWLRGSRC